MKNIIVITLKLLVITVIAGALLGIVNGMTAGPIAEQEKSEANAARQAAFPDAASFELVFDRDETDDAANMAAVAEIPADYDIIQSVYTALDADGNTIGIAAGVTTKGYSSGLNLTVGLGTDGTIKGVIVGSNNETPGLGAKSTEPEFQGQFAGKSYSQPLTVVKSAATADNEVQAITGATITSRGVTNAVNTVIDYYTNVLGGAQ